MYALPRIHRLPPHVVNQIAAGEVIERPASVLKELLDNALDAGASRVTIDAEAGGLELLRVVDDGRGIHPEDLPLALTSHATSKLRQVDDLAAIRTLGFRGEALASIASVAEVMLQSRPASLDLGGQIECRGGELGPVKPWAGPPGTRIEVRHLFFNTPARRKFMRTPATEMGHLAETVTRCALACPRLALTFTHQQRLVYDVPASASLTDRIRLFFGAELANMLLPLEGRQGPVRVTGFIADPAIDRGNARLQYLFVNGRWVRDRTLSHALQEGYHGLLMSGRYAVAFLFLELPPELVDVNVHPTKAEVRFRDSQAVHHLVRASVRQALQHLPAAVPLAVPTGRPQGVTSAAGLLRPTAQQSEFQLTRVPTRARLDFTAATEPANRLAPQPQPDGQVEAKASASPSLAGTPDSLPASQAGTTSGLPGSLPERAEPTSPASAATEPGSAEATLADSPNAAAELAGGPAPGKAFQLHNAYIVMEIAEGMLVIDQHALHERILYEQLKTRVRTGPVEAQRLLIPEPLDLPAEQHALLLEHRTDLAALGIDLDDFGGTTVVILSYPTAFARVTPSLLVRQIAEHLQISPRPPAPEQLRDQLLRMMACKAAIKAGDPLSDAELMALLAHRDLVADSHHCPHGRPTSLLLSKKDLDRQFQRE
jgi:DNA mismatch repair protein MutL